MEDNVIQLVIDNSSNCGDCPSNCKCQSLTDYINKVGFETFTKQYESNTLPEHINKLPILTS